MYPYSIKNLHQQLENKLIHFVSTYQLLVVYRQILQIDASEAIALHGMGRLDLTEGQTKSALDALEKAITLDLNNSEYHVTLGIAYSMNNNLNLAKLSFHEAVRLKPSNLTARCNFALCLLNIGESKSAVVEAR